MEQRLKRSSRLMEQCLMESSRLRKRHLTASIEGPDTGLERCIGVDADLTSQGQDSSLEGYIEVGEAVYNAYDDDNFLHLDRDPIYDQYDDDIFLEVPGVLNSSVRLDDQAAFPTGASEAVVGATGMDSIVSTSTAHQIHIESEESRPLLVLNPIVLESCVEPVPAPPDSGSNVAAEEIAAGPGTAAAAGPSHMFIDITNTGVNKPGVLQLTGKEDDSVAYAGQGNHFVDVYLQELPDMAPPWMLGLLGVTWAHDPLSMLRFTAAPTVDLQLASTMQLLDTGDESTNDTTVVVPLSWSFGWSESH